MLIICVHLCANNYTITIESSSNLEEWNTIHTTSVSSDTDNKFYRAVIEEIDQPDLALENSTLIVSQSWSQETNYERNALVQVPNTSSEKHPVIIFLHGAGGNATGILNTYSNQFDNYIKVAMNGYLNKWNIKSEPTKADDIEFLNEIILQLKSFSNVDSQNITLLGHSNGAGIVLKALIELPENTFQNGIHIATQLTEDQYRNNKFWFNEYPSDEYDIETSLPNRNKIISFHGTNDTLIPYNGGYVNFLNSVFHGAHESAVYLANGMGYQNSILEGEGASTINPNIKEFAYLNNKVIHYKVLNGSHGLSEYKSDMETIILSHIE